MTLASSTAGAGWALACRADPLSTGQSIHQLIHLLPPPARPSRNLNRANRKDAGAENGDLGDLGDSQVARSAECHCEPERSRETEQGETTRQQCARISLERAETKPVSSIGRLEQRRSEEHTSELQ